MVRRALSHRAMSRAELQYRLPRAERVLPASGTVDLDACAVAWAIEQLGIRPLLQADGTVWHGDPPTSAVVYCGSSVSRWVYFVAADGSLRRTWA